MPKFTPQQLREIYLKLPEDLKDAIFSVNSAEAIQVIGKKYNLSIDKIGELADETGMVMLGITHPSDFIINVARRVYVDKETAGKIAEEINTQIFAKVRESLKKIHGVGEAPTPSGVGAPTSDASSGRSVGVKREDIIKEIESGEENIPPIIQGTTQVQPPANLPTNPFEAKTKEEVFRMPPVEKKYPSGDPYREPLE